LVEAEVDMVVLPLAVQGVQAAAVLTIPVLAVQEQQAKEMQEGLLLEALLYMGLVVAAEQAQ
jgi:hypothetical protein